MKSLLVVVGLLSALWPSLASAHEMRPGYLEIRELAPETESRSATYDVLTYDVPTYDVLWKVPARGENMRLGDSQ